MGSCLEILASCANILTNLKVLLRIRAHLVTELRRFAPSLDLNLTRDCSELVDIPRPNLLLNRQQLQVELLLVGLLEEGDEELAGLEDLRAEHGVQEALVVLLALGELPWVLFLGLDGGQGRNNHLRVGAQEEIAKDLEVGIQTFDAPLHGERVNRDHHALIFRQTSELLCDILIHSSDDAH